MMNQRETGESIYGQAGWFYEGYPGERTSGSRQHETFQGSLLHDGAEEKVYESRHESKNGLCFRLAVIAMATIIIIAILCVISGADSIAWLGFGIASFAVFLLASVTIDKIQ